MLKSNAPTKLTVAFASGTGAGPVNAVPLTPGSTPGTASYQTGFTSVNMEPTASGGVPPFGADFNGLLQNVTTAQIWNQAGYMWPFDSTFASATSINGYPNGSVLLMGNGNGLWINTKDNNKTSPDAVGAFGWWPLSAVGASNITTTGGTTVPDSSVLGATTLIILGALNSNAVLQLPLWAGARWIIVNSTTGAYTLTVQGASGIGVSITQGSALTCFSDGTNYLATSANISGQYLPINGTAVAATKLATARAFSISGFATATAVNFDGTGNVAFNVTALNVAGALGYTPANDAAVVHIAGTETIAGAKTFATQTTSNASGSSTNPSAMAFVGINSFGGGYGMAASGVGAMMYLTSVSTGVGMGHLAAGSNTSATDVITWTPSQVNMTANVNASGNITSQYNVSGATGSFTGTVTASTFSGSLSGGSVSGTTGTFTAPVTVSTNAGNAVIDGLTGLGITANMSGGGAEVDFVANWKAAVPQGFNFYTSESGAAPALIASIFNGSASFNGALTCTTSNATASDRRLKRDIRKFEPRPLHRSVRFVEYTLKESGWHGLGSVAQEMQKIAPEHIPLLKLHGRKYLGIDYQRAAYEESFWAGREIDRLAKRVAKLERMTLPRRSGWLRRAWEKVW